MNKKHIEHLSDHAKKRHGIAFTESAEVEEILDAVLGEAFDFLSARILEPSCGTGNFLVAYFDRATPFLSSEEDLYTLLENIQAYDIQEGFIDITQELLFLRSLRFLDSIGVAPDSQKIIDILEKNILVENFLSAEIDTKFDLIIGNPPYVRTHNIDPETKRLLKDSQFSEIYSGYADLSLYFIYKSYRLLSDNGRMMFITSRKFSSARYGHKFRTLLYPHLFHYREKGEEVFQDVQIPTVILGISKQKIDEFCFNGRKMEKLPVEEWDFDNIVSQESGHRLGDLGISITNGLVSGYGKAHIIDDSLKKEMISRDPRAEAYILPVVRGKDISNGNYSVEKYIIYATRENSGEIAEIAPLMEHFSRHRDGLEGRSWYKKNGDLAYYVLQSTTQVTGREKYATKRIGDLRFVKIPANVYYLDTVFVLKTPVNVDEEKLVEILSKPEKLAYFRSISNKIGQKYEIHKNKFERIVITEEEKEEIFT